MKISVIGTGYVGLVQGAILSEVGHDVICIDIDELKIKNLKNGIIPIYEPGLEKILEKNIKSDKIKFTTDIKEGIKDSDIIFIAVGTPPKEDGSADLQYVLRCAKDIAKNIEKDIIIINKSTVPVGTGELVEREINSYLEMNKKNYRIDVVSNPEFLREGKAVLDCLNPSRIVIGLENDEIKDKMEELYSDFIKRDIPVVFTNRRTSEMIKYASNAFLAVKISYINEISALAEKVGADTEKIAYAMGLDDRISPKFLKCGAGYGGSCFPKDTKAIVEIAKRYGENLEIIESAISANEKQKRKMVEKIVEKMEGIEGKQIGILGLTFKPETDDMREAPSIDIIEGLVKKGATVKVYCPKGMEEGKWRLKHLGEKVIFTENTQQCLTNVEAIVLVTEWEEFKNLEFSKIIENLKDNFFFDLRNLYLEDKEIRKLFKYYPVGVK